MEVRWTVAGAYVVFGPTELIETKGEPNYERNIFRLRGDHYILVSGRWFKGVTLDGSWTSGFLSADKCRMGRLGLVAM